MSFNLNNFVNYLDQVKDKDWVDSHVIIDGVSDKFQKEIKDRQQEEIWNVPHIDSCYLIKSSLLPEIWDFYEKGYDPDKGTDMAFCANLREEQHFMYLDNTENFADFLK